MSMPSNPALIATALTLVTGFNAQVWAETTQASDDVLVVTANLHGASLADAPASISIVDREELQLSNADDWADALSAEEGVNIRSIGQTRRGISIRGMPVEHTLYLIDGRRVSSSNGVMAHTDFELGWLPMSAIERIEVVRGPLSSLYGSDALGGVVNLITRVPEDEFSGEVSTTRVWQDDRDGGDASKASFYMSGAVVPGTLAMNLSSQWLEKDELKLIEDPQVSEIEARDSRSVHGNLIWTPSDNQRIDLGYTRGKDERNRNVASRSGYYNSDDEVETEQVSLAHKGDWTWGSSSISAYQSSVERDNTRTAGSTATPRQKVKDRVAQGHLSTGVGRNHWLILGGQLRRETLYDPRVDAQGKDSALHKSLFFQDEVSLSRNLQLVAGASVDNHERYGNEVSPRLYAVYEPRPNLVLKAGYGEGFRAPTLSELSPDYQVLAAGGRFWVYGNPDLEPEQSATTELGLEYMSDNWNASARMFRNNLDNLVQSVCSIDCGIRGREIRYYENIDEAVINGVELGWGMHLLQSVDLSLNYTYLDTEDRGTGDPLEFRPEHSANLAVSWHFQPRSQVRWRSELIGRQYVGDGEYAPSYALHHLDLAWNLDSALTVNAGVENLMDTRLLDKSELFGLAEPGRTVRVGLTARF
ncbi:TonB-dependent receptor domain-containing protein [Marinobacterium stanieri]|uniref:TonB-dependent receptor domain-containing protein n=1 Tax=Marinobacterium stanieri TaxID=49186 RepID=UPI0002557808|nr:TonB-dependent receptor [Marinobacterium stanieri]